MSEQIKTPIRGLHTICDSAIGDINSARHIIVDQNAQSYSLNGATGALEPLFKLKGGHVSKSYMLQSKALAQGSLRNQPDANPPLSNLLAVLSKDTPIQIWDVDN